MKQDIRNRPEKRSREPDVNGYAVAAAEAVQKHFIEQACEAIDKLKHKDSDLPYPLRWENSGLFKAQQAIRDRFEGEK